MPPSDESTYPDIGVFEILSLGSVTDPSANLPAVTAPLFILLLPTLFNVARVPKLGKSDASIDVLT